MRSNRCSKLELRRRHSDGTVIPDPVAEGAKRALSVEMMLASIHVAVPIHICYITYTECVESC